jgi:protein-S-isoprenylcysteine O-methyltransferase Ste14
VGEEVMENLKEINTKPGVVRSLIRTFVFMLIMGLALFIPAKNLVWSMAWVYLGGFLLTRTITLLWVLRTSPDLLIERSDVQEGTKGWDRLLSGIVALYGPLSIWLVAGLDARANWSLPVPRWIQLVSFSFTLIGGLINAWAMASNKFFSGTVRIQTDRNHSVATEGPYRFIRHPGYAGGIIYDLATPLALGSLWCFIPSLVTIVFIIYRTYLEDVTLQKELTGYVEYTKQTRWRLMPGVW